MSDGVIAISFGVVILSLFGLIFFFAHQGELLQQETIRTLVSQGVPALEAACAARQD